MDNFKDSVKIIENNEESRILELQKLFKSGKIHEKDIGSEDHQKLLELYDKQNEKLKQEIEKCKEETAKELKNIKLNNKKKGT